jgi:maleylacetoacetate isomerase
MHTLPQEHGNLRILYGYWRSSASWRIRIALELKKIPYEYKAINLAKQEDSSPEYLAVNPAGTVPTFIDNGFVIRESMAALEYLDEMYPQASYIPRDPQARARVREISLRIVAGTHPLQNNVILSKVERLAGAEAKANWAVDIIGAGLCNVEDIIKETAGRYCVGDELTMADLCLVPQAYNAARFGVDLSVLPTVSRVLDALRGLEAFANTVPEAMPDAAH